MKRLKRNLERTFGFIFNHPLAKKHPVRSLVRLLIWQFQIFLHPKKKFIKSFAGDLKINARKGLTGITGNIYVGLHDFNDMGFLLHFLREEDLFFDIGSNVGAYTLLAAGICGAKTITVEPTPPTFEILSENILLNGLNNRVSVINAAAGETESKIRFTKDRGTTNHVVPPGESFESSIIVPVITLDSLTSNETPSLIKMDVEGFETAVLKGAQRILNSPVLNAIIVEMNGSGMRYGYDERDIHILLLSLGFQAYTYEPFSRKLNWVKNFGTLNTIYCRDADFVNMRLSSAKKITVLGETF